MYFVLDDVDYARYLANEYYETFITPEECCIVDVKFAILK